MFAPPDLNEVLSISPRIQNISIDRKGRGRVERNESDRAGDSLPCLWGCWHPLSPWQDTQSKLVTVLTRGEGLPPQAHVNSTYILVFFITPIDLQWISIAVELYKRMLIYVYLVVLSSWSVHKTTFLIIHIFFMLIIWSWKGSLCHWLTHSLT